MSSKRARKRAARGVVSVVRVWRRVDIGLGCVEVRGWSEEGGAGADGVDCFEIVDVSKLAVAGAIAVGGMMGGGSVV